ncbi:unnamed protein product, partial [Phaeothamnion confervicola]
GGANCSTRLSHIGSNHRFRGLWRRGGVYQYRVRVPVDLVTVIGRSHINRSLKTNSLREAQRAMMAVGHDLERFFASARSGGAEAFLDEGPPEPPFSTLTPPAEHVITLRETYDAYLADPSRRASPKSLLAYQTVGDVIMDLIGPDFPLRAITRQVCRKLMIDLIKLPKHARKRWPNLNARQAIARGGKEGIPTISVANINGHLNKFCAMLNWAAQEELIGKNPAVGLRLPDPVRAKDKRKPFSPEQLRRIFQAPLFTGCVDDDYGYAKTGPNHPRRSRYWVPLIGLCTGARLNEICQLDKQDVCKVGEIWCFKITKDSANSNTDKRLKTVSSDRTIPVHPLLLDLGFDKYVAKRMREGGPKLFPELPYRH